MSNTKPSRELELQALRGMLSDEELAVVHAYWLEQGADPALEQSADDSLISVLRGFDGGLAAFGRMDSAYDRIAEEIALRTVELRAAHERTFVGNTVDLEPVDRPTRNEPPSIADRDSAVIEAEPTRTIQPVSLSTPSAATPPEATFLSRPPDNAGVHPDMTVRDGGMATPTEAELIAGLQLGAYRIVRRLGQGGMGTVFLAEHVRMERLVALKVLSPQMTRDPHSVKRFQREVKAAAKLSHPNIVTAFDADEARGLQILVMEYVEGTDLAARVKTKGPLTVLDAIECTLQAARGLAFAHQKGVVHRDIKPANLLIDGAGVVKVLDMGLARIGELEESATAGLTSTGTIMGTAEFMAPEQALDTRTAGAPADIYSLGCTLYYLLTGKAPFTGDTLMKILLAHRDRSVPKLGDVRADAPVRLDSLFQRMVAKQVGDRSQSMAEVIAELEAIRAELLTGSVLNPGGGPVTLTGSVEPMRRSRATAPERSAGVPAAMTAARSVSPPAGKFSRWLIAAAGSAAVILLAVIITLKTREGKLVLTVEEPDATIEVFDGQGQVEVTRKGETGTIVIGVDPGKHRLKVQKDGFTAVTESFEIGWGGTKTLKATLVPLSPDSPAKVASEDKPQSPQAKPVPSGDWVDLLALVELPRHAEVANHPLFAGKWSREGTTLLSPIANLAGRLELPFEPPREYELVSEIERITGEDGCMFGVVVDGHAVEVGFDVFRPVSCGLSFVDGQDLRTNGTRLMGSVLKHGVRHTLRIVVGQRSVTASVDGREVVRWEGDPHRLSPATVMPNPRHLYMGSVGESPLKIFSVKLRRLENSAGTGPYEWDTPEFRQWLADVKDLPAAKLLEAVSKKMVDLNPGFDGKLAHLNSNFPATTPVIERGQVVEVGFVSREITNIAPLRAFGTLRTLVCLGTPEGNERGRLSDLTPLRGMEIERFYADWNPLMRDVSPLVGPRLRELRISETGVTDLSPLRGSAVTSLNVAFSGVTDIRPLTGLPLETLNLAYYGAEGGVTDLSPLQGMPLKQLSLRANRGLTDITPLKGLPLEDLDLLETGVESLEPLRGTRLTTISISATKVSDMSPLQAMPLREIGLDFDAARDTAWLRSIKTLESINDKPAAEFWKEVAGMSATSPKPAVPQPDAGKNEWDTPEFRKWLAEVKDLPASKLVEAVEKKLAELNPGFDGKLSHPFSHIPGPSPVIERGKVVEVGFSSQWVRNIAPLRAFGKLRALSCAGSSDPAQQPSSLVDLSPLRGMEIERLAVCWNQKLSDISPAVWPGLRELLANDSKVADLTPLRGTPLRKLLVDFSGVVDLSPLEGMPLEELGVSGDVGKTLGVTDLSPLKGMRLKFLSIAQNSSLSDISALAGMPLDWLVATGTIIDSLEPLRGIKLRQLALIRTRVTDLSPLKDMPLEALELNSTPVSDLTPLQGAPLTSLQLLDCDELRDCSPLKGTPLKDVYLDFDAKRDTEWLRSLQKLERINGKPVAEFWKEVAAMSAAGAKPGVPEPVDGKHDWDTAEFRKWLAEVKDLPPVKLLEAVSKKMVELNPGFDGQFSPGLANVPGERPVVEDGRVVEVGLKTSRVADLSPLRAFGTLHGLTCLGWTESPDEPQLLVDLSPLRGMKIERFHAPFNRRLADISPVCGPELKELDISQTIAGDLSALRGVRLRVLTAQMCGVRDLSPLKGMPLETLFVQNATELGAGITDLSPLQGMPLRTLSVRAHGMLTDLSPLVGMPLELLDLTDTRVENLEPIRGMKLKSLACIGTRVTDLSALQGMPLTSVELINTPVSDLSPLRDCPLKSLHLLQCPNIKDMSVIGELPLEVLWIDYDAKQDEGLLKSHKSLTTINGKPVAEFWKEVAAKPAP